MVSSAAAQRNLVPSILHLVSAVTCGQVCNRPDTQSVMGVTVPRSLQGCRREVPEQDPAVFADTSKSIASSVASSTIERDGCDIARVTLATSNDPAFDGRVDGDEVVLASRLRVSQSVKRWVRVHESRDLPRRIGRPGSTPTAVARVSSVLSHRISQGDTHSGQGAVISSVHVHDSMGGEISSFDCPSD